jgi:hypothetical protein
MDNLMKNEGRISPLFESRIAARVKMLVDEYAQKALKPPRRARLR